MFLQPNTRLDVSTLDGYSDFILLAPLPFQLKDGRLLRVRVTAPTDGLTSPKFIKCYLQTKSSFRPAVAHDGFYRGFIEESLDGGLTWTRTRFDKPYADAALLELCEASGVPTFESKLIYDAVAEFGQAAWEDDAALREAQFALAA